VLGWATHPGPDTGGPTLTGAALLDLAPTDRGTTTAAGIAFAWVAWGDPTARPVLLLHGVGGSVATFWRIGPALAAAGWRVVAVDQPGHGRTGSWQGHHRPADNAADIAAFIRAAGLAHGDIAGDRGGVPPSGLAVVGHSWGAMTAAALPVAGFRPARLVLLDPPAVPLAVIGLMAADPAERHYDDPADAIASVRRLATPAWDERDILAKAEGLTQVDETAARSIVLDNGDWDAGLGALRDPAAAGIDTWVVRGDPVAGGLLPDVALPAYEATIGTGRVFTIAGGPHSPQRTHPAETIGALLAALTA
jgi:pimeloyl-ACP methyl ester carboxylesterase